VTSSVATIDKTLDKSVADLNAICTYCPDFMKDCTTCGIEGTRQHLVLSATQELNKRKEEETYGKLPPLWSNAEQR
jgi:hypothetical protein